MKLLAPSSLAAGLLAVLVLAPGATAQVTVTVEEQIAVTDTPEALLPLDLHVDETVTVTDDPSALLPLELEVAETITVTDATTALPPLDLQVDETVTVADAPAVMRQLFLTVLETIKVFETLDEAQLPVELVDFTATAEGTDIVLAWTTASETNNAGFDVQWRAQDGAAWQTLGFVPGHGTTAEAQSYTHRVEGLGPGQHRFRLRQVDFDGATEYSPTLEIRAELTTPYLLTSPHPNPFQTTVTFGLAVSRSQPVEIAVFDLLGRRVAVLHTGELAGQQTHRFALDGRSLPSGLYTLRITGETFTTTRQVTRVQ